MIAFGFRRFVFFYNCDVMQACDIVWEDAQYVTVSFLHWKNENHKIKECQFFKIKQSWLCYHSLLFITKSGILSRVLKTDIKEHNHGFTGINTVMKFKKIIPDFKISLVLFVSPSWSIHISTFGCTVNLLKYVHFLQGKLKIRVSIFVASCFL